MYYHAPTRGRYLDESSLVERMKAGIENVHSDVKAANGLFFD